MRKDPQSDTVVPLDLRDARAHLVDVCGKTPVRLGRLFALGGWGDAVWVVRELRDLRAICLLSWVLDPSVDIDGRRRASPLGRAEFEEKILAYDKRLDELDDDSIRLSLGDANIEEVDDLIVVDVLEEDGTWDTTKSLALEASIAAIERFSAIVGARSIGQPVPAPSNPATPPPEVADVSDVDTDTGVAALANPVVPLRTLHLGENLLIFFPAERFDLEVAGHLGKRDWSAILCDEDKIDGADKDRLYEHGADFVAGVEFLSEVFVEGKPLGKAEFEAGAKTGGSGVRSMEVHFPRFGPVLLISRADGSRFVTSKLSEPEEIVGAI